MPVPTGTYIDNIAKLLIRDIWPALNDNPEDITTNIIERHMGINYHSNVSKMLYGDSTFPLDICWSYNKHRMDIDMCKNKNSFPWLTHFH